MEDAKIVELFWTRNEDAIKEKDEDDKTRWTQARPTGFALEDFAAHFIHAEIPGSQSLYQRAVSGNVLVGGEGVAEAVAGQDEHTFLNLLREVCDPVLVQADLQQNVAEIGVVRRKPCLGVFRHQRLRDPVGVHGLGLAVGGLDNAGLVDALAVGHMSRDPDVFGIGENQVGEQGVLVPVALGETEMLEQRTPVELSPGVAVKGIGVGDFTVGFVAVHDGFLGIIHIICAALHQIAVVCKGGVQHGVDGAGQEKIVGIDEHEIFAENLPDAGISCPGKTFVPLVNDRHPGVVGVGVRNCGGGVGGAVVHQNHAIGILCLL